MVECMNALDGKANKWNNMKFIWFICAIIESVSKSNSVLWFQCACEVIVDYFTCISRLWNWTSTLTIKFTRSGDMQICKYGRQKGNVKRKTKNGIQYQFLYVLDNLGVNHLPPPQKKKVFFSNMFSISHLTPSRYSQVSFFSGSVNNSELGICPSNPRVASHSFLRCFQGPYHDHFPPPARRNPHLTPFRSPKAPNGPRQPC